MRKAQSLRLQFLPSCERRDEGPHDRFSECEQIEFILRNLNLDPELELKSVQRKIEAARIALAWERSHASGDPNSVWTAFQGTTHFLAHETASKGSTTQLGKERRLVSAVLDGDRSRIAARSFAAAAQLVGA